MTATILNQIKIKLRIKIYTLRSKRIYVVDADRAAAAGNDPAAGDSINSRRILSKEEDRSGTVITNTGKLVGSHIRVNQHL